ncbi:MAG: GH92 family glycosyl hydrolase [Polyangiaceae bacterium]
MLVRIGITLASATLLASCSHLNLSDGEENVGGDTRYHTSFETTDQPLIASSYDESNRPRSVEMLTKPDGGPSRAWNAKPGVGFTGLRSVRYEGHVESVAGGTATNRLFDVSLSVTENTELSYLIFPDEQKSDAGYPSTYVSVDLAFSDGTFLSDLGAVDQHFAQLNPRGQGNSRSLLSGEWNKKVVRLGQWAKGKTIKRVLLAFDAPRGPVDFGGYIDDIHIAEVNPAESSSLSEYVVTTRGTNSSGAYSRGSTISATAVPHGFNFWTPVTDAGSDSRLYSYQQQNNPNNLPELQALALSHEPSPWIGDRQNFQIMPQIAVGLPIADRRARALAFRHENEVARAHYYGVRFENGIEAEIAPQDHSAIFRFTFPQDSACLVFDHRNNDGGLTLDANRRELSAYSDARSAPSVGASRMFIYAKFDSPVNSSGMLPDGGGPDVTGYFCFDIGTSRRPVIMRIATSLISVAQAKRNLMQEIANTEDFEDVKERAKAQWDSALGVVRVEGANIDQLTTLYSNLYRLFLYPNSAFENVGTREAPDYRHASPVVDPESASTPTETGARVMRGKLYVNHGFWDTYRTAWPAFTLLSPKKTGEMIDGFVQQYTDGGWIARWSAPGYSDMMIGTSSDVAFADAYVKGITNFDVEAAYRAARRNAMVVPPHGGVGRKGQESSPFLGYVSNATSAGFSWSMASYLNDFGIGNMALALSKKFNGEKRARYAVEAEYFLERSLNYPTLFNPELSFFLGRSADGKWSTSKESYDPRNWWGDYTETNGWNSAFEAPHDGRGLANLYGGRAALAQKLDEFFRTTPPTEQYRWSVDAIHEELEARDVRLGQLGLSNQSSYHIPYMYLFAGQPARAQETVREAMRRLFVGSDIGQGYLGDEDNGATSAWYLFGALGFYPLQVGSPFYVIGSPLFRKATVHLENGKRIVINAPNNSARNVYVQRLTMNGKPYEKTYVAHDVLVEGVTLDFDMGPRPSRWGSSEAAAPLSLTTGADRPKPLADVTKSAETSCNACSNAGGLFDDTSLTEVTFSRDEASVELNFAPNLPEIRFYTLTSSAETKDPSQVVLLGSNDDTEYVLLDRRTQLGFRDRRETQVFKNRFTGQILPLPADFSRARSRVAFGSGAPCQTVVTLTRGSLGAETQGVGIGRLRNSRREAPHLILADSEPKRHANRAQPIARAACSTGEASLDSLPTSADFPALSGCTRCRIGLRWSALRPNPTRVGLLSKRNRSGDFAECLVARF